MKEPVVIFGAAGFVGFNLLDKLLNMGIDVVGVSSDPDRSWRISKNPVLKKSIVKCDITAENAVINLVKKYRPGTVFNLAAYGAYSWQKDTEKIYRTNFTATVNLINVLKQYGFDKYIQAGSQSEYGLNCHRPAEESSLVPNSHYAVSKAAVYYLLRYYGKVEKLPVCHLRLYSVYGPWEEPQRLIPTLINYAHESQFPPLVNADISHDFIYVDDVVSAFILVARELKKQSYGEAFNIATGKKTTIRELALLTKKLFGIKDEPQFGKMKNREWDLQNWVGNPDKMKKVFGWKAKITLEGGLKNTWNFR